MSSFYCQENSIGRTIFIEIHPCEKMRVFRPHSGNSIGAARLQKLLMKGKVEGMRKTKKILDRRGVAVWELTGMGLVECRRVTEDRRLWRRITTDAPQTAVTSRWGKANTALSRWLCFQLYLPSCWTWASCPVSAQETSDWPREVTPRDNNNNNSYSSIEQWKYILHVEGAHVSCIRLRT